MYTLGELAEHVGADVVGDAALQIAGIAPFETAGPGDITLASESRFLHELGESRAAAAIVPEDFPETGGPVLRVADPKLAFVRLMQLFYEAPFAPAGISSEALIGDGCSIDPEVTVRGGAAVGNGVSIESGVTLCSGVVVGDGCSIGADTTLHANVTLYPGVTIGQRVIIHSGTVIGADGFGYVYDGVRQQKVPQTGSVRIEDEVEIGANSCVDRATFGETLIGRGVKLDNHVHVGHNCTVGENTIIVGQVGVSGSVTIGRNCIVAGHAGFVDHVSIGDNVRVMAKTSVSSDAASGAVISGHPSRDHRENLKLKAITRRLPEMYALFRALKRRPVPDPDEDE